MAKEKNDTVEVVNAIVAQPESKREAPAQPAFDKEAWKPKTELGRKVKAGDIKNIDEIVDAGLKILEPEIVDVLLPGLQSDLLLIGQSKGKFGGGQRRVFRQTQKKTNEGNKPKFAAMAVVGNSNGYVGIGYGKSKETVPAREKALRNAKLNIIKIRRGCGSWECGCREPHTIPFAVTAKCGSSIIRIKPAPKGKGLCVDSECQKLLALAGIRDVWSKTRGQTRVKTNLIVACFEALKKLSVTRVQPKHYEIIGMVDGAFKKQDEETQAPAAGEAEEDEKNDMIESIKKKIKREEQAQEQAELASPDKEVKE